MKVLSLFDWMSCWMLALQKAWISVESYFASEIDKYAIQVSEKNFPEIIRTGNIKDIYFKDFWENQLCFMNGNYVNVYGCKDIDLIIWGSPCQWFSFAGKQLNFDDPRSKLFFEYVRILKEIQPKYFLLENVRMKKEYQDIISEHLFWIQPIMINSALLSAQNRRRLYRVGERQEDGTYKQVHIDQPEDKGILLKDILEENVDEKYYLSNEVFEKLKKYESNGRIEPQEWKSRAITTMQWWHRQPKIACAMRGRYNEDWTTEQRIETWDEKANAITSVQKDSMIIQRSHWFNKWWEHIEKCPTISSHSWQQNNFIREKSKTVRSSWLKSYDRHERDSIDDLHIRKLTPVECERLQTVPDNYTEWVSNSQRYKMLGNGWTVDVIAYIFSFLK